MNIAIIGTGGVGGFFGGKLTQLLPDDPSLKIYFIARNRHLDEIRANGLLLESKGIQTVCRPTLATDRISDLPGLDIVLICVKGFDLTAVLEELVPHITEKTLILPLLNGVDIFERVRSGLKTGIVFPACVYIGTHIERPGKVTHRGGAGIIHFGNPRSEKGDPSQLCSLFDKAGIDYRWHKDPYPEIWGKYIFIAAFGLVSAGSGRTIGEIMASDELAGQVRGIIQEICSIAAAEGITLPDNIAEDSFRKGSSFPFDTKTSFQRDVEVPDKADERDLFGSTVLRLAAKNGISADNTMSVFEKLQKIKPLANAGTVK